MKKSKIKRSLKKKINPGKSNKLIYAVVAGLAVVFVVFIILMLSGDPSTENKQDLISGTLSYISKVDGVVDLKIFPAENKVIIIHDGLKKKTDFEKIAKFAGIRLSNKIEDEEVTLLVAKKSETNIKYSIILKNRDIIKEERFE